MVLDHPLQQIHAVTFLVGRQAQSCRRFEVDAVRRGQLELPGLRRHTDGADPVGAPEGAGERLVRAVARVEGDRQHAVAFSKPVGGAFEQDPAPERGGRFTRRRGDSRSAWKRERWRRAASSLAGRPRSSRLLGEHVDEAGERVGRVRSCRIVAPANRRRLIAFAELGSTRAAGTNSRQCGHLKPR